MDSLLSLISVFLSSTKARHVPSHQRRFHNPKPNTDNGRRLCAVVPISLTRWDGTLISTTFLTSTNPLIASINTAFASPLPYPKQLLPMTTHRDHDCSSRNRFSGSRVFLFSGGSSFIANCQTFMATFRPCTLLNIGEIMLHSMGILADEKYRWLGANSPVNS